MTISSTTDRVSFEGNGVTTSFPLPFRFFSNGDIQASLIDAITGLVTSLSLGVDYTLLGAGAPEQNGSPESAIGMVIAPSTGKTLFVQRVMDIVQPTDIVNQGRFFPEVHETVFDRLTMLVQQAALGPSRTIRVPESDPIPGRLPSADARATKFFGFDDNGDPAVSSLSMSAIEGQVIGAQGFAEAAELSAQAAGLSAQDAGQSSVEAGESRDEAAAIADSLTGAAVPLFSVMWWPSRAIPEGYIAADGQTLPRATYPDAWAGIQAGNVPTVAEATWQSTNTERGKFTVGDGASTFRLPDYNGKTAGSLGAVFLRGDGTLSAAIAGTIQKDAIRDIQGEITGTAWRSTGEASGAFAGSTVTGNSATGGSAAGVSNFVFKASDVVPTAPENRPLSVTGCWVIKLFGAVVNVGSADAAQLASNYANLAALVGDGPKLTKEYVSGELTTTAGGLLTITHGLGAIPKLVQFEVVTTAAVGSTPIGARFEPSIWLSAGNYYGAQITGKTALSLEVRMGAGVIRIMGATAGDTLAPAQFKLIVRAWA